MTKFIAEFTGIFFFTLIVGITANPLAIGLLLAAMTYIAADLSNAHFNPAVSLAAWITGNISSGDLLKYLCTQLTGAACGALFSQWLSGTGFTTTPAQSTSTIEFIAIEFVFSFLFVLLFLLMMYPKKKRNPVFGLMIGLTFAGCYFMTDSLSGTGLNPGMNTAYILLDTFKGGYSYFYLPVYLIAPLSGGSVAAWTWNKIR